MEQSLDQGEVANDGGYERMSLSGHLFSLVCYLCVLLALTELHLLCFDPGKKAGYPALKAR